ncbi:MAG: hypothetical protein M5R36_28640 [Deltaproteobacteria bacterium]|nr:hypothetical protein [Deltaproteobacteria bacterium]
MLLVAESVTVTGSNRRDGPSNIRARRVAASLRSHVNVVHVKQNNGIRGHDIGGHKSCRIVGFEKPEKQIHSERRFEKRSVFLVIEIGRSFRRNWRLGISDLVPLALMAQPDLSLDLNLRNATGMRIDRHFRFAVFYFLAEPGGPGRAGLGQRNEFPVRPLDHRDVVRLFGEVFDVDGRIAGRRDRAGLRRGRRCLLLQVNWTQGVVELLDIDRSERVVKIFDVDRSQFVVVARHGYFTVAAPPVTTT